MDTHLLAYLAGAMDADGYFSIKKSTYHMRVRGDAVNPVYSERCGIHQVTPEVPLLMRETFGGGCYLAKPQTPNSLPLWRYGATDTIAATIAEALLPYLRIKKAQAQLMIDLRCTKTNRDLSSYAYWFALEHPNWANQELITSQETAQILGYSNINSVSQAVRNGLLLAVPYDNVAKFTPRIPKALVTLIAAKQTTKKKMPMPSQLIEMREALWQQIRELNKMGINGTEVYHRTGFHSPK